MLALAGIAGFASVALLVYLQVAHVRAVKGERRALFDRVTHLFERVEIRQDGLDYPVLVGRYQGCPVKVEALLDTLALRKLPVLWLRVTHYRPLPVGGSVDVLVRPYGTEYFSPNQRYNHELPAGDGYPEHIRIATPAPETAPPLSVLQPFLGFLAERRTKEVLITPRGVRVVRLLTEAQQAHYRVLRRVELHAVLTEAELLAPLDTAAAVADAVRVADVGASGVPPDSGRQPA